VARVQDAADGMIEKKKKKTLEYNELLERRKKRELRLVELVEAKTFLLLYYGRAFAFNN
jgi:hypothetical protein